jgi:hypothetical protein
MKEKMASANWQNATTEQMENNTSDKQTMLGGLSTVSSYADDILAAKKWYTELLGIEPYFAPILNTQPT